jgi:hypothetical protein
MIGEHLQSTLVSILLGIQEKVDTGYEALFDFSHTKTLHSLMKSY